ncbi:MAG: hypothetical protein M0P69_04485 [Bacteroidales bacterium]|nr:hypothetical protein [Bacteroidales bacterium]
MSENVSSNREKMLVVRYKEQKAKVLDLDGQYKEAKFELENIERDLLQLMIDEDKESSARYDGVGFVTRTTPRLFASFKKEYEPEVFAFLKKIGRDDIIKTSVHSSSLSSAVKEIMEEGNRVPEFISCYYKESLRLYEK